MGKRLKQAIHKGKCPNFYEMIRWCSTLITREIEIETKIRYIPMKVTKIKV